MSNPKKRIYSKRYRDNVRDGIPGRNTAIAQIDIEAAWRMHTEQQIPLRDVAFAFSLSDVTLRQKMKALGLPTLSNTLDFDEVAALQMYATGATLNEVGAAFGVSDGTIRNRLIASGNAIRPVGWHARTTARTRLTKRHLQIIDGLLIGDGCLVKSHRKRSVTPALSVTTITPSFVDNIKACLPFTFGTEHRPPTRRQIRGVFCDTNRAYRIESKCDLSFLPIYERWYPNHGKKIVPPDIILTPTLVKYWFYGDGCSNYKGYNGVPDMYVQISLCTNGFTFADCEILVSEFARLGMRFGIHKQRGNPVLSTSKVSTVLDFFEFIGKPDVEGFAYKWKFPQSNGEHECPSGRKFTVEHKANIAAGVSKAWSDGRHAGNRRPRPYR